MEGRTTGPRQTTPADKRQGRGPHAVGRLPRQRGRVDAGWAAELRRTAPANAERDDRCPGDVPRARQGTVGDLGRGETGVKLIGTDDVNNCVHCKHPALLLSPSAIAGVSGGGRAQPPRARIWWPDGAGAWAGVRAVAGTVPRGGGRQPVMRRKGHQGGASRCLDGAEGELAPGKEDVKCVGMRSPLAASPTQTWRRMASHSLSKNGRRCGRPWTGGG